MDTVICKKVLANWNNPRNQLSWILQSARKFLQTGITQEINFHGFCNLQENSCKLKEPKNLRRMSPDVNQRPGMSQNVSGCPLTSWDVSECLRMSTNVLGCPRMSPDVNQRYTW